MPHALSASRISVTTFPASSTSSWAICFSALAMISALFLRLALGLTHAAASSMTSLATSSGQPPEAAASANSSRGPPPRSPPFWTAGTSPSFWDANNSRRTIPSEYTSDSFVASLPLTNSGS